jgi:hypothetical protein
MNVSSIPPVATPTAESLEPKGADRRNDHDGDDAVGAAPKPTPPQGQGTVVDTKA